MSAIRNSYDRATSQDTAIRYSTSWLLPPFYLFLIRATISLYAFITLFVNLGLSSSATAGQSFSYFTVLGYWGLGFYFAFAALHTGSYWLTGRCLLGRWLGRLRWAHGVFYASVTVFPFVVTVVFWTLLANGAFATQRSSWSNVSEHALNSVLAFFEIVVPRTETLIWIHLPSLIILLALYLSLAYVTHATQGFYVYDFLNPANGRGVVAGACIGILAAMCVVFLIVHYLIMLRSWITEGTFGMEGKLETRRNQSAGRSRQQNELRDDTELVNIRGK